MRLNTVFVLCCTLQCVYCFIDPVTIGMVGAAVSSVYYFMSKQNENKLQNKIIKYIGQKIGYFEGCEDFWIPGNLDGLEYEMRSTLFGQSMAINLIMSAIRNHLHKGREPKRPLVLSFHGSPGTGKNFISQQILKNMFRNGVQSQYSVFYRSSIDFPLASDMKKYQEEVVNKIKTTVLECHRSIFVFDEVEKMPGGLLSLLSGFVHLGQYQDYDFRRVIFILISNIGSDILVQETLQNVRNGNSREDMDEFKLSDLLAIASFNTEGGLQGTGLVKKFGISHYVPFLPLERHHVTQCLNHAVVNLGQDMTEELAIQVLQQMPFGPEPSRMFSVGGCKGVEEKALVLIERETRRKRKKI